MCVCVCECTQTVYVFVCLCVSKLEKLCACPQPRVCVCVMKSSTLMEHPDGVQRQWCPSPSTVRYNGNYRLFLKASRPTGLSLREHIMECTWTLGRLYFLMIYRATIQRKTEMLS